MAVIFFLCSYLLTRACSILKFIKVVHLPQPAPKYTPESRTKQSDSLAAAFPCALRNLSQMQSHKSEIEKNYVVKEISACSRLTSSWEEADGSLKNSVHFRGFCNLLIIRGPNLAGTLRSIDFLNYQQGTLLNHVLPASNFLRILKR